MIHEPGLHRKARIVTRIWMLVVAAALTGAWPSTAHEETPAEGQDLVRNWGEVQDYLHKFGYLTSSPEGGENLRTEEKLREAIKRMQKFGGLHPTGIIDASTLQLLQRKRCGMPDMSQGERVRRYAIQGQRWPAKDITWSIKQYPPSLGNGQVRMEISKAFKVWSEVSQLNFREVNSLKADIIVSFERGQHGDGYAFDGRGVVLAHAFFPGEGIGGDAHFDAEEPWVDGQPAPGIDGVRLFAVAAHEFGHSLGLSHSSVAGALMNPFYQTIKDNFQLPQDDTNGIQALYGARNPTRFAPLSPTYIPPRTRPPVVTTRRPSRPGAGPAPTRPATHTPGGTTPSERPQTCSTTFDSISVIRNEIFIFKGNYFWRMKSPGNLQSMMQNYPVEINRLWRDDQYELKSIDAAYERPTDLKIVFFSGARYWLFDGVQKEYGYPRPLTDLGLPPDLKRIDAAMVWGYNGKTYFFAGKQYWRYDEAEGRVELDYPRDMSMWRGVPYNIDAAFQYLDSQTYFFKGRKFWQFNDMTMRVKKDKVGNVNQYWFGCPSRTELSPDVDDSNEEDSNEDKDNNEEETSVVATTNLGRQSVVADLFLILSFGVLFLFHRTICHL